jgi:hypothetical protein
MLALTFTQLLHPLTGNGYQFWSGIGSDAGELAILGGIIAIYRRHNCHIRRCWRLSWHVHPEHGHPVCRRHHPEGRGLEGT